LATGPKMQRDLKLGMLLGSILVGIGIVWISIEPSTLFKSSIPYSHNALSERKPNESPTSIENLPSLASNRLQPNSADSGEYRQTNKTDWQRFHIVRGGETLSGISSRYYGSANKWRKILNANHSRIKNPNRLRPGTTLMIPE
jgi:nucleoid-associated protein YgaU